MQRKEIKTFAIDRALKNYQLKLHDHKENSPLSPTLEHELPPEDEYLLTRIVAQLRMAKQREDDMWLWAQPDPDEVRSVSPKR